MFLVLFKRLSSKHTPLKLVKLDTKPLFDVLYFLRLELDSFLSQGNLFAIFNISLVRAFEALRSIRQKIVLLLIDFRVERLWALVLVLVLFHFLFGFFDGFKLAVFLSDKLSPVFYTSLEVFWKNSRHFNPDLVRNHLRFLLCLFDLRRRFYSLGVAICDKYRPKFETYETIFKVSLPDYEISGDLIIHPYNLLVKN